MRVAGVADIGATHTRIALVCEDFSLLTFTQCETPKGDDPSKISSLVRDTLTRYLASCPGIRIGGIGISVAGPVDLDSGSIINPPNMPYDEVPVRGPLSDAFGCPVVLMNDCRAGVLGEVHAGAGRGSATVVYITISTGIGGGVYTNGEVLKGRGGNAGEIGHLTVDTTYLETCSCGFTGHWEGYSSGRGIPAFFQRWCRYEGISPAYPCRTADEILSKAAGGEPEAVRFIQALARINARGLSNVIVAYDPEIIILDGPVVTFHPDLILEQPPFSISTDT